MKIDAYAHIFPSKYKAAIGSKVSSAVFKPFQAMLDAFPSITDLDSRLAIMNQHEGYVQVLTHTVPFLESIVKPADATELTRMGNDELAELVARYPNRFVAAIGNLPWGDTDEALKELDRVINKLHFKGVQICTDINGKPLDSPEFTPLFEKMENYDLPIYIHPARTAKVTDYASEDISKYRIYHLFGWPYDTSACMVRLVLSHVLEKHPKVKIITHHCGAMIPFFDMRVLGFVNLRDMEYLTKGLSKPPLDYFKMFYADTALQGSTPGLMCGYAFFGADHLLFGTDMPYGTYGDRTVVDMTIQSIERMDISNSEKKKIFEDNAKRILHLSL